ncbi:cytochrome P450 [Gymnopus androsaceus JB14]|uniref:Cytochrome P450 n=1 Tax=Gymnopus androsaceus JB14 TaxID=1447944 RepID=A0A6A4GYL4_9AGAR|nr:cytochrome P450 [Gymnopus androsaceus JB14]
MITPSIIVAALLALLVALAQKFSSRNLRPLPPGPKRLPIIGNLLDMPTGKRWETFARWGEQWGKIVSVSFLGETFVIVNSFEVAKDLLDKRSGIYADRPDAPMAGGLVGWKNIVSFLHYGDHFKQCRRLMHTLLGTPVSLKKLHYIHEQESHKLLKAILYRPEELEHLIMHTSGALLLRVVYGFSQENNKQYPFVETADQAVNDLYISVDGFLVDVLPILSHIPSWAPGASFKRRAQGWAVTFDNMVERPFAWIKEQLASGYIESSFVADNLREGTEDESTVKWTAASMSAAGPDTTAWTVYAFFKAMAMYPDVMKRAQAELDEVVGQDRLPLLSDRPRLPYIEAIVSESLRWHPVAPLGFPHRLTEDDYYEGYFLPKGTLVQANVWKITRDPAVYPNPDHFDPTRFLASETSEVQPSPDFTFGWGRRICPGRLMAVEVLFITYAMALSVFDISKAKVNGNLIEPTDERSQGVVSRPCAFQYSIKPRNKRALELIEQDVSLN